MQSTSFLRSGAEVLQITLDYPIKPAPRWGHGHPPHPKLYRILDRGREQYRRHLRDIVALHSQLHAIPLVPSPSNPLEPAWSNPWFSGLDLAALYMFIARHRPSRYVEIGSGWSTKIARRAARDAGAPLHITSIDPEPRAEIDQLCDAVVRHAAEDVGPGVTSELEAGDILFLDSSHRVFTNSDCVIFFLEILPELKPGVLVHIHDIFLPYDYPHEWSDRYYSEQYLLAAWLIAEGARFNTELPNMFSSQDQDLRRELAPLWTGNLAGVQREGGSFWLRMSD
jgi:predicted O-methyltransferase YrrM